MNTSTVTSSSPEANNAYRVALIFFVVCVLTTPAYFVLAFQTQAWQLFVVAGMVAIIDGVVGFSVLMCRRGRIDLGIGLIISAIVVALVVASALISELGLPLALMAILVTLAVGTQTLSPQIGYRAIVAGIAAGVVAGLLDLLAPPIQLSVSGIRTLALIGAVVLLLVYGFVIVRQFQSYPLRTKLLLILFVVTLIPLGGLTAWNDRATRQTLTETANQSLTVAASQTAKHLNDFIDTNLATVGAEAQIVEWAEYFRLPLDQRAGSEIEQAVSKTLLALAQRDPDNILSYALLDNQGRNVSDTDSQGIGANESDRDYFQKPLQTGAPYVSSIEIAPDAGQAFLYFSSVARDPDDPGNVATVGVLRVRYNASKLLLALMTHDIGLAGGTSYPILLDENHLRLIDASNSALNFKVGVSDLPDFEHALAGASTQLDFTGIVHAGEEPVRGVIVTLAERPWRVAYVQTEEVFLSPAEGQTRQVILGALVLAGLVSTMAVALSQVLAGPIARLTAVAAQASRGDLTVQARVETNDEIGALALTFNSMTAQLHGLIGSLEHRVEARTQQLRASAEVGRAAASILDPDQLLRELVNLIADRFGFYYVAVFLLDEKERFAVLREATGEAGQLLKARGHKLEVGGQSMVGYVVAQHKARIALDVGQEATRFANPLLPATRSEIALPLIVGDRVLGALDVQSSEEAAFDESNASVLQSMADQIATVLNNAALYAESQTTVAALNGLLNLSREIARSRTFTELTDRALKYVETIVGVKDYYIALTDDQQTEIRFVLQRRSDGTGAGNILVRPFSQGRTEYVIQSRRPLRMSTAEASVRLKQLGLKVSDDRPTAFLGVPIIAGDRVLGMIGLQDFDELATFGEQQEQLTVALANQMAVTLENLRLADETQRALADLDAANRRLTHDAWERHLQASASLSGEWQGGAWVRTESDQSATPDAELLNVPVKVRGQTIGTFAIQAGEEGRAWTSEDVTFAQSLVDQVGQTIETARLLEETERLAGRDRLINEINSRVRQTINVDTILQTAVNELGRSLKAARVFARINPTSVSAGGEGTPPAGNGQGDHHA